MTDRKVIKTTIIDDVIITTYADGSETFSPIETTSLMEEKGWWQKLKDWWNKLQITPYIKMRNQADSLGKRKEDPFDSDVGSDGKITPEIGIKISF